MNLPIIQKRKIYFTISGTFIIITLLSLIAWGLKPGIDFTGGSLMEVKFAQQPSGDQIKQSLQSFDLGEVVTQPAGDNKVIIRFKNIDEDTHHNVFIKLKEDFTKSDAVSVDKTEEKKSVEPEITVLDANGQPIKGGGISFTTSKGDKAGKVSQSTEEDVVELSFESVGPNIGKELKNKSFKAIFYVVVAIILYIAWSFRKVYRPVTSWKYGVIAVVALIHDILITIGVFVFLGHYFGTEVNTPFIAALLTILGYSVNDTIVVFDRIRENLRGYHNNFSETVNHSVNQTFSRSINTSLTVMLTLLAVYFFGGESTKSFSLALIIGIFCGTYSSIFIASPLLVTWQELSERFRR